ncbi:MAG: hypothetical protein EOP48_34050, partial [Sphingobacteriales bacterium]
MRSFFLVLGISAIIGTSAFLSFNKESSNSKFVESNDSDALAGEKNNSVKSEVRSTYSSATPKPQQKSLAVREHSVASERRSANTEQEGGGDSHVSNFLSHNEQKGADPYEVPTNFDHMRFSVPE